MPVRIIFISYNWAMRYCYTSPLRLIINERFQLSRNLVEFVMKLKRVDTLIHTVREKYKSNFSRIVKAVITKSNRSGYIIV